MNITIYNMVPKHAAIILNSVGAKYGRLLPTRNEYGDTVDIALSVVDITVCKNSFVIGTDDGEDYYFPVPSESYYKIEVV